MLHVSLYRRKMKLNDLIYKDVSLKQRHSHKQMYSNCQACSAIPNGAIQYLLLEYIF